jgi:hypothetical protein
MSLASMRRKQGHKESVVVVPEKEDREVTVATFG